MCTPMYSNYPLKKKYNFQRCNFAICWRLRTWLWAFWNGFCKREAMSEMKRSTHNKVIAKWQIDFGFLLMDLHYIWHFERFSMIIRTCKKLEPVARFKFCVIHNLFRLCYLIVCLEVLKKKLIKANFQKINKI